MVQGLAPFAAESLSSKRGQALDHHHRHRAELRIKDIGREHPTIFLFLRVHGDIAGLNHFIKVLRVEQHVEQHVRYTTSKWCERRPTEGLCMHLGELRSDRTLPITLAPESNKFFHLQELVNPGVCRKAENLNQHTCCEVSYRTIIHINVDGVF